MNSVDNFTQWLNEGVNDPGIFKAIFLAGGPGSGKSYVQKQVVPKSTGLKIINSDDLFELKMSKADLDLDPETIMSPKGQEIRAKAKALTMKRQKVYLQGRLGLVIDGTGKDVEKVKKQLIALRAYGYDCYMVFVNTSEEVAQERNAARARSLDPTLVKKMWMDVQKNIGAFQNMFGAQDFTIVDNSSSADSVKIMTAVYKEIQKFLKKPLRNYLAKQWIENMKSLARRK
jgi:predicted kinase